MRLILIILCFVLCSIKTEAQHIVAKTLSFPGIAYEGNFGYFYGGGGFELGYQHPLNNGRIHAGIEYRMIDWGNQAALNVGHQLPYWSNDTFEIAELTTIQLGAALFREKPLFAWGLSHMVTFEWQSQKRFFSMFGVGLRYSNVPKYKEYSSINSVFEVPIQLGIGLRY